jgi:1-acyl-sn-glycerol-3-phosphate acyltransferase
MEQGGSIPINRSDPSPSSIRAAIELLLRGEIILIFPGGTRSSAGTAFKRGAASIALHAQVPIVPAYYDGPKQMQVAHLVGRPSVKVTFGVPIATAGRPIDRHSTTLITRQIEDEVEALKSASDRQLQAA